MSDAKMMIPDLTPYQDRTALIGVFTALSIVFGIAENFIGLPLPGLRLGLANIGIMLAITMLDFKAAFAVAFLKAIIVPLVTGNFIVKISIGLPATLASTFFMLTYFKLCGRFITSVSMGALGGLVHIAVQFFMANTFYIQSPAIYGLLPYFAAISVACGVFTGYAALMIDGYLKKSQERSRKI